MTATLIERSLSRCRNRRGVFKESAGSGYNRSRL